MVFGLWDSPLPATPVPAHLKQQHTGLHAAVRSLLSSPTTPDTPASSVTSTSSCSDWESDDGTPLSTPSSTPASTPHSVRFRKSPPPSAEPRSLSEQLALDLVFTAAPSSSSLPEAEETCSPPAFFPCSRIAFSPKLKISRSKGLKLDADLITSASARLAAVTRDRFATAEDEEEDQLCGMSLSVTGVVETLQTSRSSSTPTVKSTRLIADFCTDLTSGIKIWQRDAQTVVTQKQEKRDAQAAATDKQEKRKAKSPARDPARLPAGTYVLPLSMKIPASDQLPPSFESAHFRLRYTMTLALFSRKASQAGPPRILKLVHLPFQILPSTLPSMPPSLPTLTHTASVGFGTAAANLFSSVAKLVGSESQPKEESQEWQVQTTLPTCSFSPSEVVPVSIHIKSPISNEAPTASQQVFIRLTLIRRLYVRESVQSVEQEFDWGLGLEALAHDELAWERFLKEETELCQKWGVLTLPATAPASCAKTVLQNISLPLTSLLGHEAGYSTSLDLSPGSGKPSLDSASSSSWFAPAVIQALNPANAKAWDKHLHVSSRFYVAVEVGFYSSSPRAAPSKTTFEVYSGPSPFAPRTSSHAPTSAAAANKPQFPGKLRELLVPITMGSVAEPALSCLVESASAASEWAGESRGSTQTGEDQQDEPQRVEGVPSDCWVLPPPSYEASFRSPLVSSP